MASRAARRNRGRTAALAVKARPLPPGGVQFSPEQVGALLSLQRGQRGTMTARPLPRPDQWWGSPFPPGRPLPPAAIDAVRPGTGQAEPRLAEYPVAINIQLAARTYVPWKTLQDAAAMPLFRKCVEARKGICSLGFTVTVDPKAVAREAALTGEAEKDIESAIRDKYQADIARVSDWLEWPDRGNGFDWENWARLLMENRLVYDATVVYPRRTYGGDAYAWEVPDGKLFKPLIDEHGRRPVPPYPAFQQILYGYPRGEYTADVDPADIDPQTGKLRPGKSVPGGFDADSLMYERTILRPQAPNGYGMSATEIALLDGLVWMRRMGWILAEYTDGVQPSAFLKNNDLENANGWTPEQWEDWSRLLNDKLAGNTRERQRWPLLAPGLEPVQSKGVESQYRPDYDMFLIKLVAGDFGLTATELGFPEVGALGASFHEGEQDVLERKTRIPDANWVGRIATRLCVRQLGMARQLRVQVLGLESEDESAVDAIADARVRRGVMTRNEDRARIGQPPLQFDEADMITVDTGRGVVFLEGASQAAPPGTLIEPAMLQLQPGQANDTGAGQPAGAVTGAPSKSNAQAKPAGQQPKPGGKAAAKALQDAGAKVYEQLSEDYPPDALDWVHHAKWTGPVAVPLSHVDQAGRKTWAASHEPAKVAHFREQIRRKGKTKPIILVKRPGKPTLLNADGHHRYLAYEKENLPPRAFIGVVDKVVGPWDTMHDKQYTAQEQAAAGKAPDETAYSTAADKSVAASKPVPLGDLHGWGLSDEAIKEVAAYRRWVAKGAHRRPFAFSALDCGDAQAHGIVSDADFDAGRVTFGKASPPKVLARAFAGTGPAGSGTSSS